MNYGMYLSATGIRASSYRQDVIANNLANAETVGFKRNHAAFHERLNQALERNDPFSQDEMFNPMTGGLLASPTQVDFSSGTLEQTGNPLDLAIRGEGFFAVQSGDDTKLTRTGQFLLDAEGFLITANDAASKVLDSKGKPIQLSGYLPSQLSIGSDGSIHDVASRSVIGQVGLFDVTDRDQLVKSPGNLFTAENLEASLKPAARGTVQAGYVEGSNVDPTHELTQLMEAQRELEANANMIRYQDQAMSKLVNEVGKIS
jgi:flagellar basal-body rod protein FlgF